MAQKTLLEYSQPQTTEPTLPMAYEEIQTHEELIDWSKAYAEDILDDLPFEIDLGLVSWEVSTRAKRRAAAVKSAKIDIATVGIPINWEKAADSMSVTSRSIDSRFETFKHCVLSLSWGAFEAFPEDEWTDTIRHELIHVYQHQQYGKSDHGYEFKQLAREIDASIKCPKFTDANYIITCSECGEVMAERYKRSKLVKNVSNGTSTKRSGCCKATMEVTENN